MNTSRAYRLQACIGGRVEYSTVHFREWIDEPSSAWTLTYGGRRRDRRLHVVRKHSTGAQTLLSSNWPTAALLWFSEV